MKTGVVKVRLEGLPEDVETALVELEVNHTLLSVSKLYENRNSEYVRLYIEMKI
jgi:hypothetical protein